MYVSDKNGKSIGLDQKLGSGGEADIYSIFGQRDVVAKIYFRQSSKRQAKLQAMISTPPTDPTSSQGHVSICWPRTILFNKTKEGIGFLMPKVDLATSVPLFRLHNPQDRQQVAPGFTWGYLLRTAANIASVVEAVHTCGYVVGDLNESNFLVSDRALVTLVDCDSMQVPNGNGSFFRCTVGKPDFTAPELQGCDFSQVDRNQAHDNFGLGVMIFQLLMEGIHPFAGIWHVPGEPPSLEKRIQNGDCPYVESSRSSPMPLALPIDFLPATLKSLIIRCFGYGHRTPNTRPSPREWREALTAVEKNIKSCPINPRHTYPNHLLKCPWCDRAVLLHGFDAFSSVSAQKPMAATPFAPGTGQPLVRPAPKLAAPIPTPTPNQPPAHSLKAPSGRGISHGWAVVFGCIAGLVSLKLLGLVIELFIVRAYPEAYSRVVLTSSWIICCSILFGMMVTCLLTEKKGRAGGAGVFAIMFTLAYIFVLSSLGNQRPYPSLNPASLPVVDRLAGSSIGSPSGIRWTNALGQSGAVFSAADSSRIEYANLIPSEGTLEFWIKVDSGYRYDNSQFKTNQNEAMIFSSDAEGGDVTWPGTTKVFVTRDGHVSIWMATVMGQNTISATEAHTTEFHFGEWHAIGVSYGKQGQYIMLDGKLVASSPSRTQTFGRAGDQKSPLDIPTIGETVSHVFAVHQYSGGFEGVLGGFRASAKQLDWDLARGIPPAFAVTNLVNKPVPEDIAAEVNTALIAWRDAVLSNDPARLADCYAGKLDRYFLQTDVTHEYVRQDISTVHDKGGVVKAESISGIDLQEISESEVEAQFLEAYDFIRAGEEKAGTVRTVLHFVKEDGKWKISYQRQMKLPPEALTPGLSENPEAPNTATSPPSPLPGGPTSQQWILLAQSQFEHNDYQGALQSCDAALRIEPGNAEAEQLKTKIQRTMSILGKN